MSINAAQVDLPDLLTAWADKRQVRGVSDNRGPDGREERRRGSTRNVGVPELHIADSIDLGRAALVDALLLGIKLPALGFPMDLPAARSVTHHGLMKSETQSSGEALKRWIEYFSASIFISSFDTAP
jgi:hypothetical protein